VNTASCNTDMHVKHCPVLYNCVNNVDSRHYRLKEPYTAFTLGVVEAFSGYISPKPERIWMKPGI